MLDSDGVAKYWEEQTLKGDNPCHYHNKWQDLYAFHVRTGAFKASDFVGMKQVVDVGCGIGEYTKEISKLCDAHIDAFDFPFNIAIAQKVNQTEKITFHPNALPHESLREMLKTADGAYTTTVYVHLSPEAREAFYLYLTGMKVGAKVMLLEYIPDFVPEFQKNLPYKEVETVDQIIHTFSTIGFALLEKRHVNFIDSTLFFYLGKNGATYMLTRFLERLLHLVSYNRSKYKMLIFEKHKS